MIARVRLKDIADAPISASNSFSLIIYDAACRALAEAVAVDEVKAIRDEAAQIAAAARVANNHQAEADAVAIRMRATRRLGQLMQAQKESVGLATGGEHGGRRRLTRLSQLKQKSQQYQRRVPKSLHYRAGAAA
jgi:hypothetical protein